MSWNFAHKAGLQGEKTSPFLLTGVHYVRQEPKARVINRCVQEDVLL